jgi:ubiquinone/menaquinone biosynthesis C-methylase UbiE
VTAAPPQDVVLQIERHYVPESMEPGTRLTTNVRFRNIGTETISSASDPPVTIGSRWYDVDGREVRVQENRTHFPVVIDPGRAITLPVRIDTPSVEGEYRLVICPVIERQRWVATSGFVVAVSVRSATREPSVFDVQADLETPGHAEGHEAARVMLEAQAARLLARPGRRILEIGGGAAPQISWFGAHDAVNVDINLPLLEFGSIWYEHHADAEVADRLAFLCADATELPCASGTFDIVAMFSTLHHFPEPEVLLRECRRVLASDGLIGVLCEPVSDSLEADDMVRDLAKGINEQVFTLDEYEAIFAASGLTPISGRQIGASLLAFLRPTEPSGRSFSSSPCDAVSLIDGPRPPWVRRIWRAGLARATRR